MNKINILFIVPSLRLGGAERQAVDIVKGLSKERYNIHLFTFERELDQLKDLETEKIKFYNQPRRYKFDVAPSKTIAGIIDTEKIDILYTSLQIAFIYGLIGRMIARRKVKLIVSIHTTITSGFKEELFDYFLYAPLLKLCDSIIMVCDNQRKYWAAKCPFLRKKFITIHNGIDTEKFKDDINEDRKKILKNSLGIQDEELVVGMVAGLMPGKGHKYALKVMRVLLDSGIKLKLILVGDGKRKRYLQSLAEKLNVSQNIIWLGFQKEPKIYISIFDIFLLVSTAETFSIAMLEALSMNKPVIATDIGGASEMVSNGVNGYLIRPKKPKEIAEKIKYLAENRNVLKELSKNARQSVINNFDLSQTIKKTERLFDELRRDNDGDDVRGY